MSQLQILLGDETVCEHANGVLTEYQFCKENPCPYGIAQDSYGDLQFCKRSDYENLDYVLEEVGGI